MDAIGKTPEKSNIKELLIELGCSGGKSLEYICSQIGEPQRIFAGDPLRCRCDSISCVWNTGGLNITMYFDSKKNCFGMDIDHIMLSLGTGIHTRQGLTKLFGNFI